MLFRVGAGLHSVDCSLFPDKQYQTAWLKIFLEFKAELLDGATVSENDVERLYVQVAKFVLVRTTTAASEGGGR